jgi:hypothetical protein
VLRLHPSDDDKPATSENPSSYVNQGASGGPASKVLRPNDMVFIFNYSGGLAGSHRPFWCERNS